MTDQELKDLVASLAIESEKTDRRMEKTDRQVKKQIKKLGIRIKETSKQMKKTDKQMKETDKQVKETSKQMKETDKQVKETSKQMKETDKQVKETSKQMKETDKQVKETSKQIKETDKQVKETDKQVKETSKQMKETDERLAKMDEMAERWDNFLGNYGESVEEYFYRSLDKEKKLGKLKFDNIKRNIRKTDKSTEYDIILINGDSVGIVEVKSKAHPKDIKPLIKKKIKHFKLDYPEYENYKYYFAIATMVTNEELIKQAKDEGISLLTQNSDHLELVYGGYNTF